MERIVDWLVFNNGAKWTEKDIRYVLGFIAIEENCYRLGKALGRTPGSIRWIFQSAHTPIKELKKTGNWLVPSTRLASEIGSKMGIVRAWNPSVKEEEDTNQLSLAI